ncbi:MAG: hypothetical protein PHC62_00510 [Candidatus Izemoplasmatales bacterium]|nr:hypothetical protein [Candidatus Izemoplasmatales bacterium]
MKSQKEVTEKTVGYIDDEEDLVLIRKMEPILVGSNSCTSIATSIAMNLGCVKKKLQIRDHTQEIDK